MGMSLEELLAAELESVEQGEQILGHPEIDDQMQYLLLGLDEHEPDSPIAQSIARGPVAVRKLEFRRYGLFYAIEYLLSFEYEAGAIVAIAFHLRTVTSELSFAAYLLDGTNLWLSSEDKFEGPVETSIEEFFERMISTAGMEAGDSRVTRD